MRFCYKDKFLIIEYSAHRQKLETTTQINVLLSSSKPKGFSISVSEHLYNRFNKHLRTLKHATGTSKTRQKWLEEAFLEKLANNAENLEDMLTEKLLHFKVEKEIYDKIHEIVESIRKYRNFSKKQWLLEAIHEKLDREEALTQNLLKSKLAIHVEN